jgi:hypothetical protein
VWAAGRLVTANLQMVAAIAGVIGLQRGFVVLRTALRKTYSGFRISLVPIVCGSLSPHRCWRASSWMG